MPNSPCSVCHRYQSRSATADTLTVADKNVLLIRRTNEPFRNFWALPGGYVDQDETTFDAALRELQEETGLVAETAEFFGFYDNPSRDPKQNINFVYVVTNFSGTLSAGDDANECMFFPFDSLPTNLAFDHRQIIADYLKGKHQ